MGRIGPARSRGPAARRRPPPAARDAGGAGARSAAQPAALLRSGAGASWPRPPPCWRGWPRWSRGGDRPSRRGGAWPGSRGRRGARPASPGRHTSPSASGSTPARTAPGSPSARSARCAWSRRRASGCVDAGDALHRLSLARGVLHAMIWAPPGQFFVDTPSAVAVDLGCRYTLEVDGERGRACCAWRSAGSASCTGGVRSLVPAGAVRRTRRDQGPGTPYYETPPRSAALDVVDFGVLRERGETTPSPGCSPRPARATRCRSGTCCRV